MHNGHATSAYIDPDLEFSAFEQLPPAVRRALCDSPLKLEAASLLSKRWPEPVMLAAIEAQNNGTYDAFHMQVMLRKG